VENDKKNAQVHLNVSGQLSVINVLKFEYNSGRKERISEL